MLMDNTLELLSITDSNIKITRFSAESSTVRNATSSRNGSKILHTRLTELHRHSSAATLKEVMTSWLFLKTD